MVTTFKFCLFAQPANTNIKLSLQALMFLGTIPKFSPRNKVEVTCIIEHLEKAASHLLSLHCEHQCLVNANNF